MLLAFAIKGQYENTQVKVITFSNKENLNVSDLQLSFHVDSLLKIQSTVFARETFPKQLSMQLFSIWGCENSY